MEDLRFGTLVKSTRDCSYKHITTIAGTKENKTQRKWMEIFYASVLGKEEMDNVIPQEDSMISRIVNCQREPSPEVCSHSADISTEALGKFMEQYVLINIEDMGKFQGKIFELIRAMPESRQKIYLLELEDEIESPINYAKMGRLLAACLNYSLKVTNICEVVNVVEEEEKLPVLMKKTFDKATDDPHGRANPHSRSEAIEIEIQSEVLKNQPFNVKSGRIIFHHFERCVNFIERNGFIITSIKCSIGRILVKITEYSDDILILRMVEKEDYDQVYHLISKANKEFREKVAWQKRELCDMAIEGLTCEKWLAYAYFRQNGELIAFLDNKI